MKTILLKSYPHILAIILFILVSYAYFYPQLQNKVLNQSDVVHFKGMAKEIVDFRETNNKEPLWTNRPFCGMPTYLISTKYSGNKLSFIKNLLFIGKRPASYMFVAFIGFYIALLIFGVNPWLSMAGAIAYGLSTFLIIFFEAGHNTKIQAIALIPPVIASVYLTYRKNLLLGLGLFGIFLGLQIFINHPQIVYYTAIAVLIYIIFEFVDAVKNSKIFNFIKISFLLFIPVLLAVGSNLAQLWSVYEYSKYSTRSKSDLVSNNENETTGLDKDYALSWSYGVDETLTILIPNFKGGSSNSELSTDSETYKILKQNNIKDAKKIIKALPLYFGDQPWTSGPIYLGAIVMFLFIFGTIVTKGPIKWWLITVVIVAIIFSWGKNFMLITDLLMDYFPGYNKFRDVKMIMVIAMFAAPLLGFIGLKQLLNDEISKQDTFKAIKYAFIISGGISLFFVLFSGIFSFNSPSDSRYPEWLIEAIKIDRKTMLRSDSFRSFIYILLAAATLWFYLKDKIRKNHVVIFIGLLVLIDLWTVDRRYLNNDNFERERIIEKPYQASKADEYILKDNDPDFRVLNLSVSTFQDASTSYFHNSLGGYHGAKMQRYQEMIEYHLQNEMQQLINVLNEKKNLIDIYNSFRDLEVINMLNTKYIIYNRNAPPLINMHAFGNSWFVDSLSIVDNANEEINILNRINPLKTAVIDKKFESLLTDIQSDINDSASIQLIDYSPNQLTYNSKSLSNKLAVFSEIYYPKGWNAYIDGKLHDHLRANYILRALIIPKGEHTIQFKFEPTSYFLGNKISFASSLILILLLFGVIALEITKEFKTNNSDVS